MSELPKLSDFPQQTYDKLRYGDTDRQGHVNNAVVSTFYETGRVGLFEAIGRPLNMPGSSFALARICIDFRAEIFPPGTVEIGTAVKAVGNSSITFTQAIYQNGKCVGTAESVLVRIEDHRSVRIEDELRAALEGVRLGEGRG